MLEHGLQQVGPVPIEEDRHAERQRRDDDALQLSLAGQGADPSLQPEPLADGSGDRLEHLRQVAAHLARQIGRHGDQVQVFAPHPPRHRRERLVRGHAHLHFLEVEPEFLPEWRRRVARGLLHRLVESETRAKRIGHVLQRLGELCIESPEAAPPMDAHGQRGREETQRGCQRGEERPAGPQSDRGEQDHRGDVQQHELPWLDEEEHRREIAQRSGDVPRLVLLEGAPQHCEREQREQEDRSGHQQERKRREHQSSLDTAPAAPLRAPRMIWIVR